jgi:hypothetical protein
MLHAVDVQVLLSTNVYRAIPFRTEAMFLALRPAIAPATTSITEPQLARSVNTHALNAQARHRLSARAAMHLPTTVSSTWSELARHVPVILTTTNSQLTLFAQVSLCVLTQACYAQCENCVTTSTYCTTCYAV